MQLPFKEIVDLGHEMYTGMPNISMVQQMRNLGALVGKAFILVVTPLKVRDGTGCPVRPVALVL